MEKSFQELDTTDVTLREQKEFSRLEEQGQHGWEVEGEGEKPGKESRVIPGKALQVFGRSSNFTLSLMARSSGGLSSRKTIRSNLLF